MAADCGKQFEFLVRGKRHARACPGLPRRRSPEAALRVCRASRNSPAKSFKSMPQAPCGELRRSPRSGLLQRELTPQKLSRGSGSAGLQACQRGRGSPEGWRYRNSGALQILNCVAPSPFVRAFPPPATTGCSSAASSSRSPARGCSRWRKSWLVFRLTGSSALLGVSSFASLAPVFLFATVGGTVADRVNRHPASSSRRRGASMGAAARARRAPPSRHTVRVWHVFVLAGILGVVNAFRHPGAAGRSLVEMVGARGSDERDRAQTRRW